MEPHSGASVSAQVKYMAANPYLFQTLGVTKFFSGTAAIRNISLGVNEGEVVGVIGENGAGKSTLMKVIAGIYRPDEGQIQWNGQDQQFKTTADAIACGISLIHQELNLIENLSIADNIHLGREPQKAGWIKKRDSLATTSCFLEKVGLSKHPATMVHRLSLAEKQLVEIAKAISKGCRLLIMDEPTSSLSHKETVRLFEIIEELKSRNTAVIYISHRLAEIARIADRVEVLKDGNHVASIAKNNITYDDMIEKMVGRRPHRMYPKKTACSGKPLLEINSLKIFPTSAPIDFNANAGEIIAITGLLGSGRTQLLEIIFGIKKPFQGRIAVNGKCIKVGNVRKSIEAGISLVTEDRKATGLHLNLSLSDNMFLTKTAKFPLQILIDHSRENGLAAYLMSKLSIKAPSPRTCTKILSGGNQQKVAIAKWMSKQPVILMLDEPTRGVDIAARRDIYELLKRQAQEGNSVIIVSSDVEEVAMVSTKVLVMRDFSIVGELVGEDISQSNIIHLVTEPNQTSNRA